MSALTGPSFEAFSAATQGEWPRALRAMQRIPVEEWDAFVMAVGGLSSVLHTVNTMRREAPPVHRVCDNCLMANHGQCSGSPCGCTVDHAA